MPANGHLRRAAVREAEPGLKIMNKNWAWYQNYYFGSPGELPAWSDSPVFILHLLSIVCIVKKRNYSLVIITVKKD